MPGILFFIFASCHPLMLCVNMFLLLDCLFVYFVVSNVFFFLFVLFCFVFVLFLFLFCFVFVIIVDSADVGEAVLMFCWYLCSRQLIIVILNPLLEVRWILDDNSSMVWTVKLEQTFWRWIWGKSLLFKAKYTYSIISWAGVYLDLRVR